MNELKKKMCSFATTVSELTRGSSTGSSGGKGHVKSASVSSPGPSAAENITSGAQQSDSLGPRYKLTFRHSRTLNTHTHYINPRNHQIDNRTSLLCEIIS